MPEFPSSMEREQQLKELAGHLLKSFLEAKPLRTLTPPEIDLDDLQAKRIEKHLESMIVHLVAQQFEQIRLPAKSEIPETTRALAWREIERRVREILSNKPLPPPPGSPVRRAA